MLAQLLAPECLPASDDEDDPAHRRTRLLPGCTRYKLAKEPSQACSLMDSKLAAGSFSRHKRARRRKHTKFVSADAISRFGSNWISVMLDSGKCVHLMGVEPLTAGPFLFSRGTVYC
jgi:hypothetical protein